MTPMHYTLTEPCQCPDDCGGTVEFYLDRDGRMVSAKSLCARGVR